MHNTCQFSWQLVEQCLSETVTYNIRTYKQPFLYIDPCHASLWHSVVE